MKHKLTRRELLKTLAILGVGIKLAPRRIQAQSGKMIVIGAGASGLVAAYWLMDEGYDVTILEARDRVGGRAWSSYALAPYPIELGAEFVHGSEVATWDLLEDVGQDSLDEADGVGYVYFEKELWTEEELNDEYEFDGDLEALLEILVEEWSDESDEDISLADLLDYFAEEYEDIENADIRQLLINKIANEYGAPADKIGVKSLVAGAGIDSGEGDFVLEEGYTALMTAIADKLDVQLNTVVTSVNWSSDGVEIMTADGTEYEADQVVITLPLGVLRANKVAFSPPLPDAKQNAINTLGIGHVDKLILKFDEAFWDDDMAGWDTPLDSQIWWRNGLGRDDEQPILTALIGGEAAIRFEGMTEAEVIQAGLSDLEQMFELENLADNLVEGHFISWGTDPYALMGYSYIPVNGVGLNAILAEPVDDVLFFAGEATHANNFATVHGAIESGIRVAEEIIESNE